MGSVLWNILWQFMWKLVNNNMSDLSIRSDTGHHLEFFWSFIHRLFSEYWIPGCLAKPAHATLLLLRLPAIGRSTIMQQRQGWAVSFCFGCNRRKWEIKLGAKWRSQGRRASSLPRLSHLRSWQPPLAPRKTTLCKWIFSMCFLKRLRNMFLHTHLFCQAGVCNANYSRNFAQQQSVSQNAKEEQGTEVTIPQKGLLGTPSALWLHLHCAEVIKWIDSILLHWRAFHKYNN